MLQLLPRLGVAPVQAHFKRSLQLAPLKWLVQVAIGEFTRGAAYGWSIAE
jgi:hypothetical protein